MVPHRGSVVRDVGPGLSRPTGVDAHPQPGTGHHPPVGPKPPPPQTHAGLPPPHLPPLPRRPTLTAMNTTDIYLKNQMLIAMPHLADPNFAQSLIYLVEHNEHGAMGLVVNHPNGLELADIMEQLRPDQPPAPASHDLPAYSGGPVQTDRGFVLHDSGWQYQATLDLGELALSTSLDVLYAIADGHGPRRSLIALGYAG